MKTCPAYLLAGLIFFLPGTAHALKKPSDIDNYTVKVPSNTLNITVDPRIELITTVQLLSSYYKIMPRLTEVDSDYKGLILSTYQDLSSHDAVETVIRISQKNYDPALFLETMLHLNTVPDLSVKVPFSSQLLKRIGGKNTLGRLTADLRTFTYDSSFLDFFQYNAGLYQTITSKVFDTINNKDLIDPLEKYYGKNQNSYTFILSPLSAGDTYGFFLGPADTLDAYCVLGPIGIEDSAPIFGDLEMFQEAAWHQFGHSFVNFITAANRDSVNRNQQLFDPLKQNMQRQGIKSWEDCVNEHIVQAVMTRLYATQISPQAAKRNVEQQQRAGLAYLAPLVERLQEYEKNREQYSTLARFYPRILNLFDDLSRKGLQPVRKRN